jgi:hypothetical protein
LHNADGEAIGKFDQTLRMEQDEILKALIRKERLLELELQKTRHESLIAARTGDYRRVAQLTVEAARLNQQLVEAKVHQEIAR